MHTECELPTMERTQRRISCRQKSTVDHVRTRGKKENLITKTDTHANTHVYFSKKNIDTQTKRWKRKEKKEREKVSDTRLEWEGGRNKLDAWRLRWCPTKGTRTEQGVSKRKGPRATYPCDSKERVQWRKKGEKRA